MIRIKNWTRFQHYKHRDPPWIRLYRGLLNDREWHNLDGDAAKSLVMLWLIASERDGNLPDLRDLSFRLRMTEKQCAAVISQLDHWLEQDASSSPASSAHDAPPETETETEERQKDSRSVAIATRPSVIDPFEEFWKAYPKRGGANPKAPARKKFQALVKSGADPATIIAGARRYASEIRGKNQIGTQYVAQAMTWLNQRRDEDYQPATPTTNAGPPPGAPTDEELRERYGNRANQTNEVPADPDHTRELQRASAQVRGGVGEHGVPDDHAGDAGMQGVGTLFRPPLGRSTVGVPSADERSNSGDDRPDAVAGVVRPELHKRPAEMTRDELEAMFARNRHH